MNAVRCASPRMFILTAEGDRPRVCRRVLDAIVLHLDQQDRLRLSRAKLAKQTGEHRGADDRDCQSGYCRQPARP
jgi:hypothetical protein